MYLFWKAPPEASRSTPAINTAQRTDANSPTTRIVHVGFAISSVTIIAPFEPFLECNCFAANTVQYLTAQPDIARLIPEHATEPVKDHPMRQPQVVHLAATV